MAFGSSWEPEDSSILALVFYSILYSALTAALFLAFFLSAHSSISLPVRIFLSVLLWSFLGGPALGLIAVGSIGGLIKKLTKK